VVWLGVCQASYPPLTISPTTERAAPGRTITHLVQRFPAIAGLRGLRCAGSPTDAASSSQRPSRLCLSRIAGMTGTYGVVCPSHDYVERQPGRDGFSLGGQGGGDGSGVSNIIFPVSIEGFVWIGVRRSERERAIGAGRCGFPAVFWGAVCLRTRRGYGVQWLQTPKLFRGRAISDRLWQFRSGWSRWLEREGPCRRRVERRKSASGSLFACVRGVRAGPSDVGGGAAKREACRWNNLRTLGADADARANRPLAHGRGRKKLLADYSR